MKYTAQDVGRDINVGLQRVYKTNLGAVTVEDNNPAKVVHHVLLHTGPHFRLTIEMLDKDGEGEV